MRKILFVVYGSTLQTSAVHLAINIAAKCDAKLKGLFVGLNKPSLTDDSPGSAQREFIKHCNAASVQSDTLYVNENQTDKILDETAFADVVICGYVSETDTFPGQYLVSSSHSPLLIVQQKAIDFRRVIFAYDGNLSSIYAIKQFTYLFPFTVLQNVSLVSVLPVNIREMEYDSLIRDWVVTHHPNAEVTVLKGDLRTELSNFINARPESIVVMGAYGRSALSMFFKESLATTVLKNTSSPIFITHL